MHSAEKKQYSAPVIKIITLKQAAHLLESSCVFPECMEVEKK